MHVAAHLDVDVVPVESADEVAVLVELTAPVPADDGPSRPPATLQVVLDRSGSMSADGRLEGAKQALLALVDRLDPTDNFGLVSFEESVRVEVPAGPLTDKAAVRARIAALVPGGMTDLSAGYLRGLQEARRVATAGAGATLLLISDGHANQGVTDPAALTGVAKQGQMTGVTTSTLGYGLGYDEVLLGAIADGGAGSALFGENPDDAGRLIAGEVSGLLSKAAQAASLQIRLRQPVAAVQLVGGLPSTQLADGTVMVELGDFWAGETRKLLLRFQVPAMAALGLATVAELVFTWVELPSLLSHTVTTPIAVNVVPGDDASGRVSNPTVRTELAFQQAQDAKRQASDALRSGDATTAASLLREAGRQLRTAQDSAPAPLAAGLAAEVAALDELADRARWDDARRVSKTAYSSWHSSTRRRGRPEDH